MRTSCALGGATSTSSMLSSLPASQAMAALQVMVYSGVSGRRRLRCLDLKPDEGLKKTWELLLPLLVVELSSTYLSNGGCHSASLVPNCAEIDQNTLDAMIQEMFPTRDKASLVSGGERKRENESFQTMMQGKCSPHYPFLYCTSHPPPAPAALGVGFIPANGEQER